MSAFLDWLQAECKRQTRAEAEAAGQLTLGRLIEELTKLPPDAGCSLGRPHSYRGYYDQLAFENCSGRTVANALSDAKAAMGACFQGYKGGDFWMTGNTMVWNADYGRCGQRIVGLRLVGNQVEIATAPDEG